MAVIYMEINFSLKFVSNKDNFKRNLDIISESLLWLMVWKHTKYATTHENVPNCEMKAITACPLPGYRNS